MRSILKNLALVLFCSNVGSILKGEFFFLVFLNFFQDGTKLGKKLGKNWRGINSAKGGERAKGPLTSTFRSDFGSIQNSNNFFSIFPNF